MLAGGKHPRVTPVSKAASSRVGRAAIRLRYPPFAGRCAGAQAEEAGKIGRIAKTGLIGDILHGAHGEKKKALGFEKSTLVDKSLGGNAERFTARLCEQMRRGAEACDIALQLPVVAKM